MKFSNMLATAGEWLRGEGPHHEVVISSRVRLARNLRNRPFPGWAKKAERSSILELIRSRVAALPEMQEAFAESLQDLSALDRQVLVERHLISREHAAKGAGSAVVVNRRQTLSIMINEEDHLRMQSIRSGLQLKQAFKLVMDLGAFPEDQRLQIDELFIETQPAHLQKSSQQKLNAEERDHLRAQIIRERLKLFPKPDISKMARQTGGDSIVVPSNDE